jgi:hypothetical protein
MSVNAALYEFENRERKPCRCGAAREADCICADELRDRCELVPPKASTPIYRGAFEPDDFGNAEPHLGLTEDDE